jgi:hypothetical protein
MKKADRNRHLEFLKLNAEKFKSKSVLSKNDLEYLFNSIIDFLNLPYPPSELIKYFLHPNIVSGLLIEVINSKNFTADDRLKTRDHFDILNKAIKRETSNYSIDFRILSPGGNYPNVELNRTGCKYTFNNQIPILKTKNTNRKGAFADKSLINWLTRNELRFATSVTCAPEFGVFHFNFTGHNRLKIDYNCVKSIPTELEIYFLSELLDVHRRFTPIGVRAWDRKPLADINEYEFSDFKDSISTFELLFEKFDIQNDLLLRTCNYFIKAIMHWDNAITAEEAVNSNFFCLEGCLHLIQKILGDLNPKLNRELLRKFFKDDFPNGVNLFDFIEEGYSNRISLVHAEPKWGAEWDLFITSEDYYEYFDVCRILLNFIIIERFLADN